jgi:hypothetical protein
MKKFKSVNSVFCIIISFFFAFTSFSQNEKKVQFMGSARSVINNRNIQVNDDTLTAKRKMDGYALIDLGVNIFPNKNTEILGMVRIKNELGGFYGANVGFDVRQLYIKGIISKAIRYQLGDINYKLTPFTFHNNDYDNLVQHPEVFNLQKEIVNYEVFYKNNTWRQQGAALDFALEFKKYIQEIKFNGFINRINATDFNTVPDRFFTGGSMGIQQSKNIFLGLNYVRLYDLMGSAATKAGYRNNVITVNYEVKLLDNKTSSLRVIGEAGSSQANYLSDTASPNLKGVFINTGLSFQNKPSNLKVALNYVYVDPDFRSAGAQSKRINYDLSPSTYNRITNQQTLRSIGLFDMVRDEKIYSTSINGAALMAYNPAYNNALPYGIATFNRQGLNAKISYADTKEILKLQLESNLLTEIVGQGTTKLKTFKTLSSSAVFNVKKLFAIKNNLKLTAGLSLQSTERASDIAYENINLKSSLMNAGIEFEFYRNIDILTGIIYNQANGNELTPIRNNYSKITDYKEYAINLNELMLGGGLRYRFTEKIYLSALYQNYRNDNLLNTDLSYAINQFLIIYNMKF